MRLAYKAVDASGRVARGIIDAKDITEAVTFLRKKELVPTYVAPQKDSTLLKMLPFLAKVKGNDVLFFTRQLSSMISSGLTLMQALGIMKEQVENTPMGDVVNSIISEIEEGAPFSKALAKYPDVFPQVYISLIKSGEASGLLDKVMLRLADNLEKQQQLRSTIKGALMYPIIVVIGMFLVLTIMMIFVIPSLTVLYTNLNIPLPIATQIVVGLSNFVITFWPLVIGMVAAGVFAFRRWRKTTNGRLTTDDLVLHLPVFGKLIKESILTEFTRTFGLLVGSGTLVVDSLNQSAEVVGNLIYRGAIIGIAKRVEKGVSVGDAMAQYHVFPSIVVHMVKIGEQTGKMDDSLLKVSEYFEREVEESVKTLTTALEPFIIAVLGAGVAFLIISIITPIYNLISAIQ